jgi:hypothetical protein
MNRQTWNETFETNKNPPVSFYSLFPKIGKSLLRENQNSPQTSQFGHGIRFGWS